jgi:hypothetical protein
LLPFDLPFTSFSKVGDSISVPTKRLDLPQKSQQKDFLAILKLLIILKLIRLSLTQRHKIDTLPVF